MVDENVFSPLLAIEHANVQSNDQNNDENNRLNDLRDPCI